VQVAPLHPAAQEQVLGAEQVPPFLHVVEHIAEKEKNLLVCKMRLLLIDY